MRTLPGTQNVKVKQKNRATPAEPVWVRAIQREMPPYADEVVAFALVGIGLFSFFTLLSPASGAVGSAWSGALRYAFGLGGFFISAAILAAGTIMLLPKLNVEVKLNWWRVLCGEIVFVLALAYFHALIRWSIGGEAGKLEAFARAFEGRGGGMVGWAIQDLIHGLLGDVATGSVLLILIVITGSMMFGVKRHQIVDALNSIEQRFLDFAEGMDEAILQQRRIDAGKARATRLAATLGYVYTARAEAATAAKAEEEARLAAMAGRPSLVTGGTGVDSTAQAPQQREINIRELARRRDRQSPEERAKTLREEVKMRFRVNQIADRKKLTKREEGVPPLEILDVTDFVRPTEMELNVNAQIIEETVEDFGMGVQVVGVKSGPTVTQYAVQPYIETIGKDGKPFIQRVRVSRVAALAGDLALSLAAKSVRIQAPVPGTNYLGIEVPNSRPGIVALRPVMESEQYFKERQKSPLAVALGREVDGTPFAVDLTTMPHLLIGGTTGSGKSVCITSLAACLIANNRPDQLKLVMIDPKMVELVRFNGVPHLLGKVEVELDRIVGVLRWVTREMERRYKLMEQALARNIVVYNQGVKKKKDRLPYMVVLIDELAELMTEFHDETEHLITRLAQMARATGIHLVVATQRPSTDVVTGLIKANFPSRIAFAVPSGVDSRVIIDSMGAEDLIGRGDMLYQASDAAGPIRLQGCFISDREMDRLVEFWQTNWHEEDEYEGIPPWEKALSRQAVIDETDDMLEDAIRFCQENTEVSTSLLQRRLNVGYPRAGRLMDALAKIAVVGPDPGGGKPRRVLIAKDVDPSTYLINWRMGR
jgi:DNA segregation ATPase FtsK/SpoIIIE-like protein